MIDYRPDLGILLLGYLNGKTLCNDDFQRPGVIAKAAAGCRTLALRAAVPRPVRHVRTPARVPENRQDNGFKIPHDYLDHADDVRRDRAGADRDRSDHRAVQQRPAGRQLHRRRRAGVADRLRVLRQQRPLLRARQHLERVRPVHRAARRAGHARTTAAGCATRSPGPTCRASSPSTAGRCGAASRTAPAQSTSTSGAGRWSATRRAVAEFKGPHFDRLLDDVQATD